MGTSLLLADDSPTIARILGMALQSEAYDIRSVLTAEAALKELKANPPFFFLVDLNLPEKDGYQLATLIKADSKLRQIRILFLSSAFEPVDEEKFKACGADGVIAKPFDPSELREKLRQIRDAPATYPAGYKVQGSLSGHVVEAEKSEPSLPPSAAPSLNLRDEIPLSPDSLLSNQPSGGGDADSILSSLLSGNSAPTQSPTGLPLPERGETTDATAMLDLSGADIPLQPSSERELPPPPPTPRTNQTGSILLSTQQIKVEAPPLPPPAPSASPPKGPTTGHQEPLSANAEALAAFFAAEIDANTAPPPLPAQEEDDSFDASLSSIDWASGPKEESLNAWSSSPAPHAPKTSAAPPPPAGPESFHLEELPRELPMTRVEEELPPPSPSASPPSPPPSGSGASAAGTPGSFLFDTGNSSFRFSDDYIRRITKSFRGSPEEMPLGKEAGIPSQMFPKTSTDQAPSAGMGGGAWSPGDLKRIEQLVKEEVQMVVREVAEKIAWEVIPELAENLIRKELDKVLKEMEEN